MPLTNSERYENLPRPRAYLLVYEHTQSLHSDLLNIHASCYAISIPEIERAVERASGDEQVTYHALGQAEKNGFPVIEELRGKLAHSLVMTAALISENDCVLIPRRKWDRVQAELVLRRKYAGLWKRLAKRYFSALSYVAGAL